MKKCIVVILLTGLSLLARATHITGGEMFYTYVGFVNGAYQYNVTLKLYQRCNSGRSFPDPTIISIFDKATGSRVSDMSVSLTRTENISLTNPDPCITNPPVVCYDIAYYNFTVSLPTSTAGYVLASQVNYRINGISNLTGGQIGATYTADIPGTAPTTPIAYQNNSARFTGSDLVIVCGQNDFTYSFGAEDSDGDQLRYFFCNAYNSTNGSGGGAFPTNPPPFPSVPYALPYGGALPLGSAVTINSNTGLITGVAPPEGVYVVTVCVEEIRGGVVIATQRKDLQIHVADCNIASASLLPEYYLCGDTQTINLSNNSNSPLINTTWWEIRDPAGNIVYTSPDAAITYTFPTIGVYSVKLVINRNQPCTDSTTSVVRVFPGFRPAFISTGICVTKPTFFTDQTTSVYGTVNSWNWDFGELTSDIDGSISQNPSYSYPITGPKNVTLIVTDTRGCRDTITQTINIIDKPPLTLAFRDTLICINDLLQLQASGNGLFSWTPAVNITNANTATPTVSPPITTKYYVELNDNGCRNRDSVLVRVVDHVSLSVMNDTIICATDTIQLRIVSDGLRYSWAATGAGYLIDPLVPNPLAVSPSTTDYRVTAVIGGCSTSGTIRVTTVPYPIANAGPDTTICYNTPARLRGSTDGNSWRWSPAGSLSSAAVLNPVAWPPRTTDYILYAYDIRGCPKPGRDTVKVTVLPKMVVSAGNDTAVIINQPLQLHATGGEFYQWTPAFYLSATDIADPIAIFSEISGGLRYKVVVTDNNGCYDSAFINIKVFATGPTIFVPSAFTPNNDGKNDLLRPIGVGMKQIEYFRVFNRWGQMVFNTSVNGFGWDGRINGRLQGTNTYVWMVKAVDYTGQPYFRKGTVTLIH